jgi:hypothetical protein
MSFRLIDDDEFERLTDRQRVEYLAQALAALETLKLQIRRLLSSDADDHQVDQLAPRSARADAKSLTR